jgi:hypothetical protein
LPSRPFLHAYSPGALFGSAPPSGDDGVGSQPTGSIYNANARATMPTVCPGCGRAESRPLRPGREPRLEACEVPSRALAVVHRSEGDGLPQARFCLWGRGNPSTFIGTRSRASRVFDGVNLEEDPSAAGVTFWVGTSEPTQVTRLQFWLAAAGPMPRVRQARARAPPRRSRTRQRLPWPQWWRVVPRSGGRLRL